MGQADFEDSQGGSDPNRFTSHQAVKLTSSERPPSSQRAPQQTRRLCCALLPAAPPPLYCDSPGAASRGLRKVPQGCLSASAARPSQPACPGSAPVGMGGGLCCSSGEPVIQCTSFTYAHSGKNEYQPLPSRGPKAIII